MNPTLLLYFPRLTDSADTGDSADLHCDFRIGDSDWRRTGLSQLPGLLAEPLDELRVSVVIPGTSATSSCVEVPRKQRKHMARILPFLSEELLAGDIEETHIAAGSSQSDQVPTCAIDRFTLQNLLQRLTDIGLSPVQLTTELELLRAALTADETLLWLDQSTCHLVAGRQAVTLPPSQLDYALHQLRALQPTSLLVIQSTDIDQASLNLTLEELQTDNTQIERRALPQGCLNLPHQLQQLDLWSGASARAINLLQGDFTAPAAHAQQVNWRPFALAAGLLVATLLLYLLGSGLYFDNRAGRLHMASEDVYRSYFPQDRRIINIRTQVRNHLNQANSAAGGEFLQLLQTFVAPWQAARNQLTLKSLRYSQARNELVMDIEGRSIEQLDKLQLSLGERAELLSANDDKDGVRGRVKLQGGSL